MDSRPLPHRPPAPPCCPSAAPSPRPLWPPAGRSSPAQIHADNSFARAAGSVCARVIARARFIELGARLLAAHSPRNTSRRARSQKRFPPAFAMRPKIVATFASVLSSSAKIRPARALARDDDPAWQSPDPRKGRLRSRSSALRHARFDPALTSFKQRFKSARDPSAPLLRPVRFLTLVWRLLRLRSTPASPPASPASAEFSMLVRNIAAHFILRRTCVSNPARGPARQL